MLDAGAGNIWKYKSKESGKYFSRSEGLAVASLEMFKCGFFSSDPTEPCQVDGAGLKTITAGKLAKALQVSEDNPLDGLEGRAGLLERLSTALNKQEFFGVDARPGNMLGSALPRYIILCDEVLTICARLSSLSSFHTCFIRSHRSYHYSLDSFNRWI